jgi:hypothetical protein
LLLVMSSEVETSLFLGVERFLDPEGFRGSE